MIRFDRLFRLLSRTLCLAAVPVVILAFWDAAFYPLAIKEILIQATAILGFLFWWASGGSSHGTSIPNPLSRPLFYLCLFALLSILWTPAKQIAFASWMVFASLLLFVPPLLDYGKAEHFRTAYRNMILGVAMVLLFLSAFQINGISLDGLLRTGGGESRQRLSLTVGHNNGVAPFILAASFLAFSAIARTRTWVIRFSLLGFILSCWILIVFFLLTRSTMIGLVFGGALLVGINLWALSGRKERTPVSHRPALLKWALTLSLVILVSLIVAGGYTASRGGAIQGEYNPNLARNIVDRLRTLNPDFLWRDTRARLWTISFHMMKHHPLLGVGFSGAKIEYPFYQASFFEHFPDFPAGPTLRHTEGMHNDYLQWVVECGALGTVFLVWLLAVLVKITRAWLRGMKQKPLAIRFSESATLIACLALMMDAIFSFPAHIAPLAVCVPGMLMLWFGCVYGRKTQSTSSTPLGKLHLPLWGRAAIAAAVWTIIALPVAAGKDHLPFLNRTGVWSPLTAQVIGNAWHTRLMGSRTVFKNQFLNLQNQIQSGALTNPKDLATTLESIKHYQTRCQQVANLIPFSGDALFDITCGIYDDAFQFLNTTRSKVVNNLVPAGQAPESVLREYNRSSEILSHAGDLFQQSLRNYRYHNLYWHIGAVDLNKAKLPGISQEASENLLKSGLENLTTARRIIGSDETVLKEIKAYLLAGEVEGASERIPRLLAINPTIITSTFIPEEKRKMETRSGENGTPKLDPAAITFFQVLLPHLTAVHGPIIREVIPLLVRGGEAELARQYFEKETEMLKQPLGTPYWRFRIHEDLETPDDFNRLLEEYKTKITEMPGLPFVSRVLFLSDMQRYAPPGTEMTGWRDAVLDLYSNSPGKFAGVLSTHMLAQEALSRGGYQEAWRWELAGQGDTLASNYASVTGRRPGTIQSTLWGLTWPLMAN